MRHPATINAMILSLLVGVFAIPMTVGHLVGGGTGRILTWLPFCMAAGSTLLLTFMAGPMAWRYWMRKHAYKKLCGFLAGSLPDHAVRLHIQDMDRDAQTARVSFPFPAHGSGHLRLLYQETREDTRHIDRIVAGLFRYLPDDGAEFIELARKECKADLNPCEHAVLTCTYARDMLHILPYKRIVIGPRRP